MEFPVASRRHQRTQQYADGGQHWEDQRSWRNFKICVRQHIDGPIDEVATVTRHANTVSFRRANGKHLTDGYGQNARNDSHLNGGYAHELFLPAIGARNIVMNRLNLNLFRSQQF